MRFCSGPGSVRSFGVRMLYQRPTCMLCLLEGAGDLVSRV